MIKRGSERERQRERKRLTERKKGKSERTKHIFISNALKDTLKKSKCLCVLSTYESVGV